MKKLEDDYFKKKSLWNIVSVVCFDGAPAILGRNSDFGTLVKTNKIHIIVTNCNPKTSRSVNPFVPEYE